MRVHVFGSVGAFDGDGRVLSVGGPKQRTVLAMLCVEPGRPVSADRLVEAARGALLRRLYAKVLGMTRNGPTTEAPNAARSGLLNKLAQKVAHIFSRSPPYVL